MALFTVGRTPLPKSEKNFVISYTKLSGFC